MQIELEEPFSGEKGDIIQVALPRLQDLAKNMDLQHLPYRLVSLNLSRTVLHLCIEGTAERHIGHQFFSLLIESNQNKLKPTKEHKRYRGMARALRNLYTHHLFNTPVYVNKLNGPPRPAALGLAPRPRSLAGLLQACAEQEKHLNLYPCSRERCSRPCCSTPAHHRAGRQAGRGRGLHRRTAHQGWHSPVSQPACQQFCIG